MSNDPAGVHGADQHAEVDIASGQRPLRVAWSSAVVGCASHLTEHGEHVVQFAEDRQQRVDVRPGSLP